MKKISCMILILTVLFSSCSKISENRVFSGNYLTSEHDSYGLPMVMYATFVDLREIKNAFDTMQREEFISYMRNEKFKRYITGEWDYENLKALLEELFSTTVPLLDEDENNFPEIGFYWERNEVQQLIFFDENSRVSAYSYTPQSGRDENSCFGLNNEKAVLLKELNCNGVSVFIYKTDNEETFFADALVDGTYVFFRTKDIESVEELEECFARLSFVKIGDLLNESETEATQTESVTHTVLSSEETTEIVTTETAA